MRLFSATNRTVIRHGAGHVVPTGKTLLAQYRAFLGAQLACVESPLTASSVPGAVS